MRRGGTQANARVECLLRPRIVVDRKLPLHRLALHLGPRKLLRILVDIVEVHREPRVGRDPIRERCVERASVVLAARKAFLPDEVLQREGVVVGIVAYDFARLRVVRLEGLHDEAASASLCRLGSESDRTISFFARRPFAFRSSSCLSAMAVPTPTSYILPRPSTVGNTWTSSPCARLPPSVCSIPSFSATAGPASIERFSSRSYSASRSAASSDSINLAFKTRAWSLLSSDCERTGLVEPRGAEEFDETAGPVEVGSGLTSVDCERAEGMRRATGGVRTDGMGVEPREPEVAPATDEVELDRAIPGGASPGRRKDCRDEGREPSPAASISVKTNRRPPPSAAMPVGVLAPSRGGPPPNPLSRRLFRLSPRSSNTRRSSFASSKASSEPYRSSATSSIGRPSSSAASYVRRSLVMRHAEPDEPGAGEPVEGVGGAAAAEEAVAGLGAPCQ